MITNGDKLLEIINHYGVLPQLKYFQSEVFELNEAILNYEYESQGMYPSIDPDVYYEARLVFQFGRSNPEFSLTVIVFDKDDKGTDEIWDELEVTLSEDARKQFRKIAWDKLGEALFNL